MPQKRCSDGRLLRLAHGEPGWMERLATRLHVTRCQACRQRQAELESLEHALRRVSAEPVLTPERVDAARQRFQARIAQHREPVRARRSVSRAALGAAATLSCVVAAGLGLWRYEQSTRPVDVPVPAPAPVRATAAAEKNAVTPAVAVAAPVLPPVIQEAPAAATVARAGTEVALLAVLHEEGLCRQGSVDLVRESGRLIVRGVVNSSAEAQSLQEKLERAAAGQPVGFELRSPDEVTVPAPAGIPQTPKAPAAPLGNDLLREYLQKQSIQPQDRNREANRIANEIVRLASTMSMEAWALHRLDDRAQALEAAVLSTESAARLRSMRAEHLDALQRTLSAEQALLEPVVGEGVADAKPDFTAITRLSNLLQDIFAAPRNDLQSADAAREELRNGMASAAAALR